MLKRRMCEALLAVLCCLPVVADAATCRAADAAQAGSQAGYEQAKKAAEAWAERERTVSDQLEECLSRIRMTSLTLPTFPSLQSLMNQVIDKVCQTAVNKVNDSIPSNIDPWQELTK